MISPVIGIAIGGGIGCVARYAMTTLIEQAAGKTFPAATLAINILGSFLMGFLFIVMLERLTVPPALRAALLTGVLGGFTTFSTFSMEVLLLAEQGQVGKAILYITLSVLLGLLAAYAGVHLARSI